MQLMRSRLKEVGIAFGILVVNWLILVQFFGVTSEAFRWDAFAGPYPGITRELRRLGGGQ